MSQTSIRDEIAKRFFVTPGNVKHINGDWYVTFPKVNSSYKLDDVLIQRIHNAIQSQVSVCNVCISYK